MNRRAHAIRASDAERERALEKLRDHASEGRLDLDEFEERMDAVLSARTRADLRELLRDLPPAVASREGRSGLSPHLRVYLAVNVGLVAIWALTGMGYFWPIWPILGWGIGVLAHAGALGGSRSKATRRKRRSSRGSSARSSSI